MSSISNINISALEKSQKVVKATQKKEESKATPFGSAVLASFLSKKRFLKKSKSKSEAPSKKVLRSQQSKQQLLQSKKNIQNKAVGSIAQKLRKAVQKEVAVQKIYKLATTSAATRGGNATHESLKKVQNQYVSLLSRRFSTVSADSSSSEKKQWFEETDKKVLNELLSHMETLSENESDCGSVDTVISEEAKCEFLKQKVESGNTIKNVMRLNYC